MAQITVRAVFNKGAILFSGMAMICIAQTAEAGFEWKGTLVPPAAETPAAESLSGLEPVIMWDGASSPDMPAQKVAPVEAAPAVAPVPAEEEESVATIAAPAAPVAPSETGEVISGFGADLPLVIALQQVVPAGYQFSFAKDVNPGAIVSWDGGRPWQVVVADMLSGAGLGYRLQNNVIVVGKFSQADAAPLPGAVTEVAPVAAVPPMPLEEALPVPSSAAKSEQIPDDLTAPPAGVSGDAPVDIRRQKPSKLLKRMTTWGDQSSAAEPVVAPSEDLTAPPVLLVQPESKVEGEGKVTASSAPMPVPEETPVAAPASAPAVEWKAAQGETLREVLKKWAAAADVELYWSIDYDYRLAGDVSYADSFDNAVAKLLEHYGDVRPQPYGQIHRATDGSRVLIVKSYDLTP